MDNHSTDNGTITAAMSLAGALIVLVSTVAAIVNSRLLKARNAAQRDVVISNTFAFVNVGFCVAAFIVNITLHARGVTIGLLCCAAAAIVAKFLQDKSPPSRVDVLFLVLWLSFLSFVACMYALICEIDAVNQGFKSLGDAFLKK
jgi:hypothetical protein